MSKYKKGDRVRIIRGTQYARQNSGIGTVTAGDSYGGYSVTFDDGYKNSYNDDDLEFPSLKSIMGDLI